MSTERIESPASTPARTPAPAGRRKRFEAPRVEDLGGLTLRTLGSLGGEGLRESSRDF